MDALPASYLAFETIAEGYDARNLCTLPLALTTELVGGSSHNVAVPAHPPTSEATCEHSVCPGDGFEDH